MKENSQGEFIGHTFCPSCSSKDNVAAYKAEDGTYNATCFGPDCGKYYTNEQLKEHGMLDDLLDGNGKPKFTASKKEPITFEENEELKKRIANLDANFKYRGIRAETLNYFGHKVEFKNGQPYRIYYPETNPELCVDQRLHTLTGYKPRTLPKTFGYGNIGQTGKRNELSGQFRFRNLHGKYILITLGGENDKAAAYQMLKDGRKQSGYEPIPVVAPTVGESGGVDQIRAQYDFLDQFENIVICGDADKAGRAALKKICDVLPKEKIRVFNCTFKDAHAMLEKGMEKQFVADFFGAEEYGESGIKDSVDALDGVKEFLTAPRISLPPYMHRLQENMRGGVRSTGAIVNIIAHTSSGKCLGKDTPVLMADASVKMVQDVVEGDYLMGDDGSPRKVLSTVSGTDKLYKVKQVRGMDYVVNSAHILSLRAGYTLNKHGFKKGDIVNVNVERYMNEPVQAYRRSLKGYKADMVKFGEGKKVKNPWLLGLWLAEGCQRGPTFTVNKHDVEIINRVKQECEDNGYTYVFREERENCVTFYVRDGFNQVLVENNLLCNKHIPEKYLSACYEDRMELLAGILDGDGHMTGQGYEITQKSNQIADGLRHLCLTLNLEFSRKTVKKGCQNNFVGEYERMFIYGRTERIPNTLSRKKCKGKSKLRGLINTAIEVEEYGYGEYYGFSIDGNRLFCLGDGTVTHNTLVCDNLMYHWLFNSPLTPTVVSLERTAEELMIDFVSMHMKKNLSYFQSGEDAWEVMNSPEGDKAQKEISVDENGRRRFMVIDERDGNIETLKAQMEKSAKKHGSRLFIIDPLTDLLRSLGTEVQESFMQWQKLMKKNGLVFLNVLHTRKPPVDAEGNTKHVTEYDALGSGTFVQSADINIVLNRNKNSPDPVERNTMYVDMPKCRGGITGPAAKWYFDMETREQVDYEDWAAQQPDTSWQEDDSAPAFDSSSSGETILAEKKETF